MSSFITLSVPYQPPVRPASKMVPLTNIRFNCNRRELHMLTELMKEKDMSKEDLFKAALENYYKSYARDKRQKKLMLQLMDKYPL